jgi:hypothetical protein
LILQRTPTFPLTIPHGYDSYIGDDGHYVRNVRASTAATHDDFLEDQVNNDEVSLAVSNGDTESCYDHHHDNNPTVTIPAASTLTTNAPATVSVIALTTVSSTAPATVSIPAPAPSSASHMNDTAALIVHNLINGRVDVASKLHLKFISEFRTKQNK